MNNSKSNFQTFRYGKQDRREPVRKEPISAKEAFVKAILRARGIERDD